MSNHHRSGRLALVSALFMTVAGCVAAVDRGAPAGSDGGSSDDNDDNDDTDDVADDGPSSPATFVYQEVAGTACGNGTPAGIGLAPQPGSRTLVIIMNGGGACWDTFTCFGLNAATHLSTTYGPDVLETDLQPLQRTGLTDRGDDDNPFATANFAFVPYCTGDLGNGRAVRRYQTDLLGLAFRDVHHVGRNNAVANAVVLASRFPDVDLVYVMGASAGGYAAVLNDDLVVGAFPAATVHVLADGAPFVPPQNGLFGTWQAQWDLPIPADCDGCDRTFSTLFERRRAGDPSRRFALLTTTNDEVIRTYFGYGVNDMTPQVNAIVDAQHSQANSHAFVVTGVQHVLIGAYAQPGPLRDFVKHWATGSADWSTITPNDF
jgi:hypothetical protein